MLALDCRRPVCLTDANIFKKVCLRRIAGLVLALAVGFSTPALAGLALAPQADSLSQLIPLTAWDKQFKITDGKDRGRVVSLTLRRDQDKAGSWYLSFGDYAGVVLSNNSGRGLMVERLDLFKSHSQVVYEPALPILTPEIIAGTASRLQAGFKMFDAETGRLKRSGRVTHWVKRVSPSRFDTPAGVIDGYFLEIDHRMDMPYAQLQLALGLGCRLDEGPVFGSGLYTLTKLGIFTETKTSAAALTKVTSPLPSVR